MPRFHCPAPLHTGEVISLPDGAARHVQVLRMQPGDTITLFSGEPNAGEFEASIEHMGRSEVRVVVGAHAALEREAARQVHLVVGVPANDRMDWLVEKASELGVTSIQPVLSERSVLRLSGERADKKRLHWQAIAIAACEQCGRNRVPVIHGLLSLNAWLTSPHLAAAQARYLLSLQPGSSALHTLIPQTPASATFLSGPEGGLSASEEKSALAKGFIPVSLGNRVLRAETAALAALTLMTTGDNP